MNKCLQTGRLVADLERSETTTGTVVAKGRIAVDDAGVGKNDKGDQNSGFFNVVSYGPSAEAALNKIGKGWLIAIDGRLQHEVWTDKQTQTPRQAVTIVGHIEFLAEPRDRGNGKEQQQATEAEADKEGDRAPQAIPNVNTPVAAGAGAER